MSFLSGGCDYVGSSAFPAIVTISLSEMIYDVLDFQVPPLCGATYVQSLDAYARRTGQG
jgi:hypothetical protein